MHICRLEINYRTIAEAETMCKESLHQDYCCTARNRCRQFHSDCHKIVNGSFENVISLASGLNRIRLRDTFTSVDHRDVLSSLLPLERQRLKDAMELECNRIYQLLNQASLGTETIQREYETAIILIILMRPSPIRWLPTELLILIFSFTLTLDEQDQQVYTLMQTCRKWKEIALSLWAPLNLATWTSSDQVKAILDRGGLLSITINLSSDAMDCPINSP